MFISCDTLYTSYDLSFHVCHTENTSSLWFLLVKTEIHVVEGHIVCEHAYQFFVIVF